jgi:hypothetical protein
MPGSGTVFPARYPANGWALYGLAVSSLRKYSAGPSAGAAASWIGTWAATIPRQRQVRGLSELAEQIEQIGWNLLVQRVVVDRA